MRMRRCVGPLLAMTILAGCGSGQRDAAAPAATATSGVGKVDAALLTTGGDGSDWAMTGFNYQEQRFSPLSQVNAGNVGQLGLAWFADMPDARGQEATPVVVDGKLFVTGPWSKVFAYDAATGAKLWEYDPKVDPQKGVQACCDVVNRGVAAWKGQLFVGTLDGRLIALNAETGTPNWSVQTTDNSKPYTITGAPRVVKDMVLIGNGGAEFGVRGYVTAYDVATGAQKWRFYTVPNPTGAKDGAASDAAMAKVAPTWSANGQWKQSGGGGTVWDSIVYDAELDQLYLGVGNGSPWNHGLRSEGQGDNLFLSSIVALKPETGQYLWHYQETPAETWDFTATQPIVLATLTIGGQPRKVLMQAPKNGFFYVVDRTNGRLINAGQFIPGVNWATGYDMKTGRPIENPASRYYRTGKPFLALPSAIAAHNWQPMAFSPQTGLAYIPAQTVGSAYLNPSSPLDQRKAIGFNVGQDLGNAMYPRDAAAVKGMIASATGSLVAWDPVANKPRWKVDYPTSWNGGTMATAGNLVFQGTSLGEFRAYAADTGKQLFAFPAGTGIMAGAATYMVKGKQYVAVLAGRGGALPLSIGYAIGKARDVPNNPRLLVFALGGKAALPPSPGATPAAPVPLPDDKAPPEQVAQGKLLFGRYCQVCHGASAMGGGVLPNLQNSPVLSDADTWKSILIDGALKERGMVSFARVITPEQAQAIRHYVIDEARWARANLGDGAAAKGARKP
ncbi:MULTISPECIES: PQQ-dependent dehydrogenase, methanol/ethanol family [Sphingomonas]|uniref:PQQ-dependent dehydrogenase, methanol/ethanol family n=1 Tax=Sphingomonas adhaesiva TaxID=28212 RepID=A0A2A4I6N6_9SPHN|nr:MULTISPECIES: PQQ-dependent dehydrogenase, methanol/ethanol family [Sphingomonas]PCG13450.1 PQQ-dependent dehydrogenase, methanol/ethanol family [Sphingomonas adhaesiva]PZU77672.1 MAG: PQQ-dependent dehydrogenase, methanol/ethanol family [Sphingomonas sp.]